MNFNVEEQAECRQFDGDFMFPEVTNSRVSFVKGESLTTLENTITALKACQRCQIKDKCLQFAMDNQELHGIWGGSFVHERLPKMKVYGAASLGLKWHEKLRAAVLERDRSLVCPPIPEPREGSQPQKVVDYLFYEQGA
jgi:WhiB family redox-sensing transcriptional regulator